MWRPRLSSLALLGLSLWLLLASAVSIGPVSLSSSASSDQDPPHASLPPLDPETDQQAITRLLKPEASDVKMAKLLGALVTHPDKVSKAGVVNYNRNYVKAVDLTKHIHESSLAKKIANKIVDMGRKKAAEDIRKKDAAEKEYQRNQERLRKLKEQQRNKWQKDFANKVKHSSKELREEKEKHYSKVEKEAQESNRKYLLSLKKINDDTKATDARIAREKKALLDRQEQDSKRADEEEDKSIEAEKMKAQEQAQKHADATIKGDGAEFAHKQSGEQRTKREALSAFHAQQQAEETQKQKRADKLRASHRSEIKAKRELNAKAAEQRKEKLKATEEHFKKQTADNKNEMSKKRIEEEQYKSSSLHKRNSASVDEEGSKKRESEEEQVKITTRKRQISDHAASEAREKTQRHEAEEGKKQQEFEKKKTHQEEDEKAILRIGPYQPFNGMVVAEADKLLTHNWQGAYTFSLWIHPTGSRPEWANLFHVGQFNHYRNPAVWFYPGTTRPHVRSGYRYQPTDWGGGTNDGCDSPENLPLNEWTWLALVHTHSTLTVYLASPGGSIRTVCSKPTQPPVNNGGMVYSSDPWHKEPHATLADLRCYNRGLSVEELQKIANMKLGLT